MTRYLPAVPMALVAFAAVLAMQAFAMRTGLVPDDAVTLWAGAIAAGDGEVPLGRVVAAYPTIPFLATTLIDFATPEGTPAPALLAALLAGLIAGIWLIAFRKAGLSLAAAAACALLLAFHPALLRAAIAGPADMWLALFLFMLAKGLYELRARSAAPEVMIVALALLGLAFSHPMGAAVAVAAVPFLVLGVRPALVANSALNVVVALVFPTVFCVGAFTYVSWVFPGSGWSFLTAPSASLTAWAADISHHLNFTGSLTLDTAFALTIGLAIAAPAAVWAIVQVHRRRPLLLPALVFTAAVLTATVLTVVTGLFGEPVAVMAAAPVMGAVAVIAIPNVRERVPAYVALLVVGWFGGAVALTVVDPRIVAHLHNVLDAPGGDERVDALNLGRATLGRDGVLIDTANAPAVVVGRGQARGLQAPQGDQFMLAMLFARLDSPFVAVPDPQMLAGAQDQLNKIFPKLYRFGAAGYRLVYQNKTWRLFERNGERAVSKD